MRTPIFKHVCYDMLLLLMVYFLAQSALGQSSINYRLNKHIITSGGNTAQNSSQTLTASVGQTVHTKAAYNSAYNLSPGFWGQEMALAFRSDKLLAGDGAENDEFGRSLALTDGFAFVGSSLNDNENGVDAGAIYIYRDFGSGWIEQYKIMADDGKADDNFGYSMAVDGDYLVVGAPWTDDLAEKSGAAYIFHRVGDNWVQQAKLNASDGGKDNRYGVAVAISGDYALIGAFFDDDFGTRSGSAYMYHRDGETWTEQAILQASDAAEADWFGVSVSIDGDMAAIGSRYDDNENGVDAGSVYIFERDGETWTETDKIIAPDGAEDDRFHKVCLSNDMLAIGAYNHNGTEANSGALYIYQLQEGAWTMAQKIVAGDAHGGDWFGSCSVMNDTYLAIGAYHTDDLGANSGAIYIYDFNGSEWQEREKITAFDGEADDNFGLPIVMNDDYMLVSARLDDDRGTNAGAVYAFTLDTTDTRIEYETVEVPTEFELFQAYPNPFNPETCIRFNIPQAGRVTLAIYNINGRLVSTLTDGYYNAGQHSLTWHGTTSSGSQAASGLYFYRIQYQEHIVTQKMLLIR